MNFKYKIGILLYLYKCTYFVSVWPSFSQWANLVQNRYTYFVPILYPENVPILYFILVWVDKLIKYQTSVHSSISEKFLDRPTRTNKEYLKQNGNLHTETKDKANILNQQFQSVFTTLALLSIKSRSQGQDLHILYTNFA